MPDLPNGHSDVAAQIQVVLTVHGEIKTSFQNVNLISALGMLEVGKANVVKHFEQAAKGPQIIPAHGVLINPRG